MGTALTKRDYKERIDAEIWTFINKTNAFYPPDTASYPIADQRRIYNELCRTFRAPFPAGVRRTDTGFGGVPCRTYSAGTPTGTLVYFHGGGFVVGDLESHDDTCAELCGATGLFVISVDYRLAPEHVHPAAFEDALAATEAAGALAGPLLLAGDSAGGTLAAAVSHALRGSATAIAGQVLIYPGLGDLRSDGSYARHAEAPLLTRSDLEFYRSVRFAGSGARLSDPTAFPLQDSTWDHLPPTLIVTAECDPLSDDGKHYCNRLRAAAGRAHWVEEAGLVHSYLRARHMSARARASFARIIAALNAFRQHEWPYG
ncbi:MAG: alpha/beta hydrolase [Rhodobacteraceae bacterium]|nr:alpha/beta hydrolase [Paracoccaceae bacterium]